ncbi:MAG: CPBP family intramembrane metalloprotease [Lachnospiraceae bacterium]|nr:CPBP family intramembrane metalloprotease [Lachnospiraceae bacterium]
MMKIGHPAMLDEARAESKGHSWIIEILIFIGVFIGVTTFESIPQTIGMIWWFFSDPGIVSGLREALMSGDLTAYTEATEMMLSAMPDWLMLVQLFSTVLLTVGTIIFCRFIEKRKLRSMGFRKEHLLREYAVGALVGTAMIAAAIGLGAAFGIYRIETANCSVSLVLAYFIGYVLQGMSEEVLCRGYFMVSVARKNPVWAAAVINSAVFAALHLSNPGMNPLALLNLFLCGLVFSVYVLKRGNIWGACALHTFWNFVQGNIFGVSVSGTGVANGATPLITLLNSDSTLLTGGVFGVEGGLLDTFVELAALLILIFFVKPVKAVQTVPYPPKKGAVPYAGTQPGFYGDTAAQGSPVIRIGEPIPKDPEDRTNNE